MFLVLLSLVFFLVAHNISTVDLGNKVLEILKDIIKFLLLLKSILYVLNALFWLVLDYFGKL